VVSALGGSEIHTLAAIPITQFGLHVPVMRAHVIVVGGFVLGAPD
jgi:hypothetical protein